MAGDTIERLNYYERQFLGAEDFKAQQNYHRDMRRRHNVGHHTWGIVTGLKLAEKPREGDPSGMDVFILPGMAVDGFGREILLLREEKLDPALFDSFTAPLIRLDVWIAFEDEMSRRPAAGFEACNEEKQFGRLNESFRVVVKPALPTHDSVLVAGKPASLPPASSGSPEIPADESVPYQELPDDEAAPLWLVRLGSVHWDGDRRKFIAATPDHLLEGRRYVGIVAEEALAPADVWRIKRRTPPTDLDAADFASVEGRLRVDGRIVAKKDVFLHGGKLSFQSTTGLDEDHPLWIQRTGAGAADGNDLRINIGAAGDIKNPKVRLTVGPPEPPDKVVLAIRADDWVEIPTGKLDFGTQVRQMINLRTEASGPAQYGIGVQTNTTYFRSHREFCWFKDGVHDSGQSVPGKDGTLQLRLDDQARFHFGAEVRQMLNLWRDEYGIGVQSSTLYFRTAADFCWFRGGDFSPSRSDAGGGGVVAMKLDDRGRLGIGTASPATTVHAFGNRIRLENAGKRIELRADGSAVDLHSETNNLFLRSSGPGGNNNLLLNPFPSDGFVGVGTVTPTQKLEVRGHIKLHPDGSLFAPGGAENLRIVRGNVQSTGVRAGGSGFDVTREETGLYLITFEPAFSASPSASVTQVAPDFDDFKKGGNTLANAVIIGLNSKSLKVKTGDTVGSAQNRDFTFVVLGPR